ncbi:hypothetical protein KSS87_020536 [Heliosperma pusillum]|nr:hypothetical protein KSS87_020536 [Heliosperma pusillum]
MDRRRLLTTLLILCFFTHSHCTEFKFKDDEELPFYNHTLAQILVRYNAAVYESDLTELFTWTCSRCNGMTEGFEVIELIVDIQHCLQAYVGYARNLNAIIIAFRGTQEHRVADMDLSSRIVLFVGRILHQFVSFTSVSVSLFTVWTWDTFPHFLCHVNIGMRYASSIQNWVEDLYWKQLDLNYPDMPDAMVHHGFYSAYHNTTLRSGIMDALKRTKVLFGEIDIIVIGHSMGGAIAAICALDLSVHHNIDNIQVMTFGQPRIGNAVFASYYTQYVPNTIRVTHDHDIVPHLPPYYRLFPHKTYHHYPTEVWLYDVAFESLIYSVDKVCDSSGEDPSCSRSVLGSSVSDHLVYLGVDLQAESWNSCKIVTGPRLAEYKSTDHAGNIVLAKDPGSSFLKLDAQTTFEAGVS